MSFGVRVDMPVQPFVAQFKRGAIQRFERAALVASDRAARSAKADIRGAMAGAGLGRLGFAIDATSDLAKGRGVLRRGAEGFSASGVVFVRSKSDRTLGTIEAYTEGAEIAPRRGGWLWIAQPDIPSRAGRYRMTPALYVSSGLEAKIGKLRFVRGISANVALLVVDNASVDAFGRPGRARGRTKRGGVRAGQVAKTFLVAFIGIRRTSRSARVDVRSIMRAAQRDLNRFIGEALEGRGS